jgi:hypothetical protein
MPRGKGRHVAPSKAHAVAALVAAIVSAAAKPKPAEARKSEGGN